MTYTVNEIQNGSAGSTVDVQLDLSSYVKKTEVGTIIDLEGLKKTIGNKLDRTPEHTHSISAIDDLTNKLDDKLSKSTKYSLNSIIDTTSSGTLTDLTSNNSLKITRDNISLRIFIEDKCIKLAYEDDAFMSYDTTTSTIYVKGIAFDKFVTDTNAVLKNHFDAIKIIAEKLELTSN